MASSYLLANAACITLWGKISDIWGRKPILLIANVVFLVGSLICALAVNMAMLLVGRATQGAGGGGIIVLVNICVTDLFSVRYVGAHADLLFLITNSSQRTADVLRYLWCDVGDCGCAWPNYWRCFYDQCILAVVFLHQL